MHTDKMNDIAELEKNLLDKTALNNRRWQLFLVNTTMGLMAIFYGFFWYWLDNKGPAYICFFSAALALILHTFIKSERYYNTLVLLVLSNGTINILFLTAMLWFQMPIMIGYITFGPIFAILLHSLKAARTWTIALVALIIATLFAAHVVDWGTWVKVIDPALLQYMNAIQGISLVLLAMLSVALIDHNYSKLFEVLGQQKESLSESKKQLERAQQYKDRFFATITHELRTPMNAIVGIVNLIKFNSQHKFEINEYQELTKSLEQSSNQLLTIINDLLDLSKLQENKLSINPADFDLREILYNAYNILKYLAQEKNIDYELNVASDLPKMVRGDGHRLTQVLVNILSNAVKFTKHGTVKMVATLDSTRPTVHHAYGSSHKSSTHLSTELDNDDTIWVTIEISDTGMGIKQSVQDHLFKEFVQANESIATQYGGTGLGLSIAKRLVELMHGHISFKSSENIGTTFTLHMPLSKVSHAETDADYSSSKTAFVKTIIDKGSSPKTQKIKNNDQVVEAVLGKQQKQILIVDDNKINLLVAQKQIERNFQNIDIFLANDGQEAVDAVKEHIFDLILMDMQMPVMNGVEATIQIRKLNDIFKANIPIVAMTANAGAAEIKACMDAGMNDTLIKPFALSSLISLLNLHLYNQKNNDYEI